MKILVNNAELLDSATFIHKTSDNVKVLIDDEVEGNMEFDVRFIKDEQLDKIQITVDPTGRFSADIRFVNFNNWASTNEMVPIGTYKNDYRLFFHCTSKTITSELRETVLMFYIVKK